MKIKISLSGEYFCNSKNNDNKFDVLQVILEFKRSLELIAIEDPFGVTMNTKTNETVGFTYNTRTND